jgi:diguanylate cyclase (GGDEF)-like protein
VCRVFNVSLPIQRHLDHCGGIEPVDQAFAFTSGVMTSRIDPTAPDVSVQRSGGIAASAVQSLDPRTILTSLGDAVYEWDVASDTLSWGGNALTLFDLQSLERIATGSQFNAMLDPLSPSTRSETILLGEASDNGSGVPYRLMFAIQHNRSDLRWFEDTGRWFAGADGRAVSARGVVRRLEGLSDADRKEISANKLDDLTGAYLRTPFLRVMTNDLQNAFAKKQRSAFLLISIHDMASINRNYGYEAADEVIAAVARNLRKAIRGKDRMVRYSGNKIGVLLTTFIGDDLGDAVSRIVSLASGMPIQTKAGPVAINLHVGSVIAPTDGRETIDLMRRAEEALAEARAEDGERFVAYRHDNSKVEAQRRNLSVSDDVLRALNDRRIIVAYEPVLSARTRVVQFHEALVRVRAENGSILGAGAIIPPAERFGLVRYIDMRVLDIAVERLIALPRDRLSVNVSMRTATTPEWMAALLAHVNRSPGIADRLIIEITETAAMADLDATTRIVEAIKDLGIRVAIDDFGSGHTSFKSLRALPVDILKIDGVFIQNLSRSTDDRFFVRTLVDLARNLGVQTVAEWVQDLETANQLAEWGVDFLQGEYCGLATVDGVAMPHAPELVAAHPALLRATG